MRKFDDSCVIFTHTNYDFFGNHMIPRVEKIGHRIMERPTAFRQVKDSAYGYVFDGSGKVNINGNIYPISRGSIITFLNYHLYRYIPDGRLEVGYCCLNNGSVCTFFNNPYFPQSAYKTLLDETAPVWQFSPSEIPRVEALWDTIQKLHASAGERVGEQQLYLLMELLGLMIKSKHCDAAAAEHPVW